MIVLQLPKVMTKRVNRQLEKKKQTANKRLRRTLRKKGRKKASSPSVSNKPKGIVGKCLFEETPLGYLLMRECPVEWRLIQETYKTSNDKIKLVNTIKSYALTSSNPLFKTRDFQDALIDYERFGLKTPNRVLPQKDEEVRVIRDKVRTGNSISFGSSLIDLLRV